MSINVNVKETRQKTIKDFLESRNYNVESISDNVLKISKDGDIDVFVNHNGKTLFFELEVGGVSEIESKELYFKLLQLNTEILPVSIGLDTTSNDKPRLVLVESRESENLDDNELLSVFEAMEIAAVKVEMALSQFIK